MIHSNPFLLGIQDSLLNTYLFLNEQSVPSLGGKVQFCYTKGGIQAERAPYCLANLGFRVSIHANMLKTMHDILWSPQQ